MNFSLKWTVDKRALAAAAARAAVESALDDAAEHILESSNRTIPIEEATLERSGNVGSAPGKRSVYYDTPYARRQHEELDYRHDSGRRAKYLEKALQEEEGAVRDMVKKRLGGALK